MQNKIKMHEKNKQNKIKESRRIKWALDLIKGPDLI